MLLLYDLFLQYKTEWITPISVENICNLVETKQNNETSKIIVSLL